MQKIDLLVHNARIITPGAENALLPNSAVAIDAGSILEVGDDALCARYAPEQVLDATGMYLFPGFINTHSHLFQVLTKGLGKERPLWDWLESTVRQMAPHMTEEDVYYAAVCGCMENLRSGVTTVLDFQYLHSRAGQFEAVCQAFVDCGMRGYVGRIRHTGDYLGLSKVKKESAEEYFTAVADIHAAMKQPALLDVALIAPGLPGLLEDPYYYDGYFRDIRACAEQLGVPYTQHLVETDDDDVYIREKTGESSIAFLEREGFFGPRCVLAHCVKMAKQDYEVFRRHDVKVSHNPVSNMILASGAAPIRRFLDEGVCVSLGIDGAGSNDSQDMLETMKFACLLQKVSMLDATALTAAQTLEMATLGGARTLNRQDIGKVEAGMRADFFLYNPSVLKSAPVADPVSSLVYCSGEQNIHTVVVDGRIVLQNGVFTRLNEGAMIERLERSAGRVRRLAGFAH